VTKTLALDFSISAVAEAACAVLAPLVATVARTKLALIPPSVGERRRCVPLLSRNEAKTLAVAVAEAEAEAAAAAAEQVTLSTFIRGIFSVLAIATLSDVLI
jgi:hypothetical protein